MAVEISETPQEPAGKDSPILAAVDFSPDSEAALLWAHDYAACTGARLVLLHVVHDPADAPGDYQKSEADLLRPMEDVATEMMDQFLEKLKAQNPGLDAVTDAERVLVRGIPATRILEVAEKTGACIIVMGSRGRTGLPHLLLGSKAERVAQMSPIPVTIVKAGKERSRQAEDSSSERPPMEETSLNQDGS